MGRKFLRVLSPNTIQHKVLIAWFRSDLKQWTTRETLVERIVQPILSRVAYILFMRRLLIIHQFNYCFPVWFSSISLPLFLGLNILDINSLNFVKILVSSDTYDNSRSSSNTYGMTISSTIQKYSSSSSCPTFTSAFFLNKIV